VAGKGTIEVEHAIQLPSLRIHSLIALRAAPPSSDQQEAHLQAAMVAPIMPLAAAGDLPRLRAEGRERSGALQSH
jgi:hypothetical protein